MKVLNLKDYQDNLESLNNLIHTENYESIKEAFDKNKKVAESIKLIDKYETKVLTIHKDKWLESLQKGLDYYIVVEDYNFCIKIRDLILKIKSNEQ